MFLNLIIGNNSVMIWDSDFEIGSTLLIDFLLTDRIVFSFPTVLSVLFPKEKTKCNAFLFFSVLIRQSRPPTARTNSLGSLGSESTNLTALSLDSLVAPNTPIQWEMKIQTNKQTEPLKNSRRQEK